MNAAYIRPTATSRTLSCSAKSEKLDQSVWARCVTPSRRCSDSSRPRMTAAENLKQALWTFDGLCIALYISEVAVT